jgi:hypothetical protein
MARLKAEDWEDIRARWCANETLRDIAQDYSIDHTTIDKRAKREGWVKAGAVQLNDAVDAVINAREKVNDVVNSTNSTKIPQLVEKLADQRQEAMRVGMKLLEKIDVFSDKVDDGYELKELTVGFKNVFEPMFKTTPDMVINNTNAQQNNGQQLPTIIEIVAPE